MFGAVVTLVERDDRAKRIIFMRDGIWVSEVSFEQLVAARHLPGNDRDTMKVLCLERYVTTGAVGSEPKIPCRCITNKNISGANSYSISLYTVECGAIVIASCPVTACVQ